MVLKSALLNENYSHEQRTKIFSTENFDSIFNLGILNHTLEDMKSHEYWKLGLSQINNELVCFFNNPNGQKLQVLLPIQKFLNFKSNSEAKSPKESSSKEKKHTAEKSFVKMIQYMNMAYALKYDYEGKEKPVLKFYNDALAPYIKDFPHTMTLDKIMAVKAMKWKARFIEINNEDFIEAYALNAYTLAKNKPLNNLN